jgi:hypothetical protein
MMKKILTEWEALELFDESLDEGETIEVLGMHYEPSRVLKNCDPIAYRVTFHDWIDAMSDEFSVEGYN